MKFIGRQCHLILHRMATTQDEFKKEKNRKLSIFGLGDKAGMEVLTIGISCKACTQYEQSNF